MPLTVTCPSCRIQLKVPDSAVGHTVKCPKCTTAMLVAAEPPPSVPVVGPADEEEAPRSPSRPVDDRSRPRPRKKKSNTGLIIGLVVGAVLLVGVCCIGGGAAFYLYRDRGGAAGPGALSLLPNSNPNVTKANYERIASGMPLAQVEAIMGPGRAATANDVKEAFGYATAFDPAVQRMFEQGAAKGTVYRWRNGDDMLLIHFTAPPGAGGTVQYKFLLERKGNSTSSSMEGRLN